MKSKTIKERKETKKKLAYHISLTKVDSLSPQSGYLLERSALIDFIGLVINLIGHWTGFVRESNASNKYIMKYPHWQKEQSTTTLFFVVVFFFSSFSEQVHETTSALSFWPLLEVTFQILTFNITVLMQNIMTL